MSLPVSRCCSLPATLAALAVAGLLTGCSSAQHAPARGAVNVSVNEWRLTPDNTEARPGSLLIVVHNSGRLAHNLVLSRDGIRISYTQPIMPGQNADLEATVQKGSYQLLSSMVDDQATGVYGTLNVG
jgi:Cupredoxin-like domain